VAEVLAGGVEGDKQIVRLAVDQQLDDVADEAMHRADRLPAGAAHLRHRMKDLINQRMGVDDINRFATALYRGWAGLPGRGARRLIRNGAGCCVAKIELMLPRRRGLLAHAISLGS
jgi:hypothetical protein